MLHRILQDPTAPTDMDGDTAASVETASAVERGERHLRLLAELTEIGMTLARSLGELAQAHIEAAKNAEGAPAPGEVAAAAAAFEKMAQTVRRTIALEAKLAAGVKARREGLIAGRAEHRAAHKSAVDEAIIGGLHDAYAATCPDDEYHELSDRLMEDAQEYLGDADEMRGYLDRPVGETVARLCAAMGLDPDACAPDGETWRVRRPLLGFELRLDERARKFPPSPSGEGQDAKRPGWGSETKPHAPDDCVTLPHPDGFAVCPSPYADGGREEIRRPISKSLHASPGQCGRPTASTITSRDAGDEIS